MVSYLCRVEKNQKTNHLLRDPNWSHSLVGVFRRISHLIISCGKTSWRCPLQQCSCINHQKCHLSATLVVCFLFSFHFLFLQCVAFIITNFLFALSIIIHFFPIIACDTSTLLFNSKAKETLPGLVGAPSPIGPPDTKHEVQKKCQKNRF
jgi:hypothetical protein